MTATELAGSLTRDTTTLNVSTPHPTAGLPLWAYSVLGATVLVLAVVAVMLLVLFDHRRIERTGDPLDDGIALFAA